MNDNYYDLIELPSGSHVPVPHAICWVGEEVIKHIPISKKIRDQRFFFNPTTNERSFFQERPCADCDQCLLPPVEEEVAQKCAIYRHEAPSCEGCHYYKKCEDCEHQITMEAKKIAFMRLCDQKRWHVMRYIRAEH